MIVAASIGRDKVSLSWLLIICSSLLRLCLLAGPELLPEEAYYWKYSVHLAPGYLDHPPFSAWLIFAGTHLFGINEFGVRIGAFICGIACTFFVHRCALRLGGEKLALASAAILSCLPYFLGNAFYASPDAPLAVAWAAALYFLIRITEASNPSIQAKEPRRGLWGEWTALGLAFGVGMLSKYSIVLLAAGAAPLFLLDKDLRSWLFKPQPYFAALITVLLFSPVIYWNATHDWASFAFQGSRRLKEEAKFGLPAFLGQFFLLPTPVGGIVALLYFWRRKNLSNKPQVERLLAYCSGLPLAVFFIFSLKSAPRLNWTGPPFLGLSPIFALHLLSLPFHPNQSPVTSGVPSDSVLPRSVFTRWHLAWKVSLWASLIGFAALWSYGAVGIPGVKYSKKMSKLIGWESLSEKILEEAASLPAMPHCKPFILGMDKHYTAAELSFYTAKLSPPQSRPEVVGRGAVGLQSLMFEYWGLEKDHTGCPAILVTRNAGDLEFPELSIAFESLGPVETFRASRNGKPVGDYLYRKAYGFRGAEMIHHVRALTAEGK